MKQLTLFHKVIIMFMLLLLLTGCCATPDTEQMNDSQPVMEAVNIDEENGVGTGDLLQINKEAVNIDKGNADTEYSYSISLVDTSEFSDLPWRDEFSFQVVQVRDMQEDKLPLENIINQNIKEAMTSWIRGKVLTPNTVNLKITCHVGKYLSFGNSFIYQSVREDFINDYVTIDMMTGQRVQLDDLLEVNEDFVEFLQENPDIIKTLDDLEPWRWVADLSEYSSSELLEELNKCSYTQEELIQNGYAPIEESLGPLLFRNSFFLQDGMLVISLWRGGEGLIPLDVDDIKDYLKVEGW